jgi:hypothetical protein
MGQIYSSYSSIQFQELQQKTCSEDESFVLINTLPLDKQSYLIHKTVPAVSEPKFMNELLNKKGTTKEIIVYGRSHHDVSVIDKYNQLKKLGFTNVKIYFGGIFEWALLQEVYGDTNFKTIGTVTDPIQLVSG